MSTKHRYIARYFTRVSDTGKDELDFFISKFVWESVGDFLKDLDLMNKGDGPSPMERVELWDYEDLSAPILNWVKGDK